MSNFLWEYILLLPACKYFKLIIYADRMLPIPLLPLLFAPITHDDDVDACIAKIIIIFRTQCEVENLWEKFCFFRFSNACTSIYWWTWKVLLTGCNRRFIKSVINALHFHSHMEWFSLYSCLHRNAFIRWRVLLTQNNFNKNLIQKAKMFVSQKKTSKH